MIYFALVGASVYGLYYHAAHHWSVIMDFGRGSGGLVMMLLFLCYVIPLFVGALVVFFLFKPIFAGRPKRAQPLALNPADNPLLYAFIEKICDTVGAPSPKRIDLDSRLNASGRFRRGRWSLAGDDMVLTIGLPLVANLTAEEYAGVVAHEFGHFTQRVGLRLSYVIESVNFWFLRVVYQRDAWGGTLDQWAEQADDIWVAAWFWVAQLGIFFERMILRLLMYTGLLIGGFLIRQMEFDTDACQIKLVGSETFERTHRKLATLGVAGQQMSRQIHTVWRRTQQLPDNLSELWKQAHESLPVTVHRKIEASYGLKRTGLFDSHPAPADRIRCARQAQDPGVFHDSRPASELFTSFEYPARFVTLLYYTDELGIPVTAEMLLRVETKEAVAKSVSQPAGTVLPALQSEYFLGVLPLLLPLQVSSPSPSADYEADFPELTQLSGGLLQVAGRLGGISEQYQQATEQLVQARAAIRLIEARVPIQAEEFNLSVANLGAAHQRETEARATRNSLRQVGVVLQHRLQLGIAVKLADGGELHGDASAAERVLQAVTQLQSASADDPSRMELAEAFAVLDRILKLRDAEGESPALARALTAQMTVVNSFRAQPAYLPAQTPALPKAHLILSRKSKDASMAELDTLRQQMRQWFADYQANTSLLIEFAQAGENLSV